MSRHSKIAVLVMLLALLGSTEAARAQTPGALSLDQTITFPSDAGVINVIDYGATGDGVTDDTAAILAAIAAAAPQGGLPGNYVSEYKIVYFPAGTYIVSQTLQRFQTTGGSIPDCGLVLVGESMSGSIIKLQDDTFTSASPVTPVIKTFSLGHTSGASGFHNLIHNLTIDVGSGNPNATGISYLGNNLSSIRNVTVRNFDMTAGSNGYGIEMTRSVTGPALIENVTVDGFSTGIVMQATLASVVLEHVSLINQSHGAIHNTDNVMVINELYVNGLGKAITNDSSVSGQHNSLIVINNSNITHPTSSSTLISNSSAMVFHATTFGYGQDFLSGGTVAEGTFDVPSAGGAAQYIAGSAPALSYSSANPVVDTPILPYSAGTSWTRPVAVPPATAVRSADFTVNSTGCTPPYGCLPSGSSPIDATQAIQNALNSGGDTIYLPHGIYYISAPLSVPQSVKRIIGMRSNLRVMSNVTSWPANQGMLHVATSATSGCPDGAGCSPLVIEYLRFDGTSSPQVFRDNAYAIDITNTAGVSADAKRDVVVRDVENGLARFINRQADGGRLFMEDIESGLLTVTGTAIVEGRHFNSEDVNNPPTYVGTTRIKNYGAPLWLLGFKTEGPINLIDAKNGAFTEILGGFFYTAPSLSPSQGGGRDADTISGTTCSPLGAGSTIPTTTSTPAPLISDGSAHFEGSFVEEVVLQTYQGQTQLESARSFPFYFASTVGTTTTCRGGGGAAGTDIQRGVFNGPGESGFIVPVFSQP